MVDLMFSTAWGAFAMLLIFQVPFIAFFSTVVLRKSRVAVDVEQTEDTNFSKWCGNWLVLVITAFLLVNLASIQFIPAIYTAKAAASGEPALDVTVNAQSWSFDIDQNEFEVDKPIRFNAKSLDTVHGFAVYHPKGDLLFTMMLIPGVGPSSLIYTFDEPGVYKVRCLEYCGLAHHDMSDEIIITASKD